MPLLFWPTIFFIPSLIILIALGTWQIKRLIWKEDLISFYNNLGFRVTEYTEDEFTNRLWAAWMHRKGGVHDIAFTNGVGPRFHHLAFWVAHPINIIDLLDLMASKGYVSNIERGPGRHGISNAFFLSSLLLLYLLNGFSFSHSRASSL